MSDDLDRLPKHPARVLPLTHAAIRRASGEFRCHIVDMQRVCGAMLLRVAGSDPRVQQRRVTTIMLELSFSGYAVERDQQLPLVVWVRQRNYD